MLNGSELANHQRANATLAARIDSGLRRAVELKVVKRLVIVV